MTKRNSILAGFLACAIATFATAATDVPGDQTITAAGQKLAAFLDATDVEHHWMANSYVDWQTGDLLTGPTRGAIKASHCSAYAAAVSERLGVYLLRPPEHGKALLANAQYNWLEKSGKAQGWTHVETPEAAQAAANSGQLVVVVYKAPDPKKPGHIAVVHPAIKTTDELEATGPEITQSGATNYAETTVSVGFNHHPGAWDDKGKTVKFFVHAVPEAK